MKIRTLFWPVALGLALVAAPRATVLAEPPTGGDEILVPKDDLERLHAAHLAMLARIAELEKALEKAGGQAEICTATWGGFKG